MESSIHLKEDKQFFADTHELPDCGSLVVTFGHLGEVITLYVRPEQGFDVGVALMQAGAELRRLANIATEEKQRVPPYVGVPFSVSI